jgi:hypothetical protein
MTLDVTLVRTYPFLSHIQSFLITRIVHVHLDSPSAPVYLLIPLPSNSLPQSFDTRLSTSND